jgi:hypothetical protein
MPRVLLGLNDTDSVVCVYADFAARSQKDQDAFWLQKRKTLRSISPVALSTVDNFPADII